MTKSILLSEKTGVVMCIAYADYLMVVSLSFMLRNLISHVTWLFHITGMRSIEFLE